MNSTRRPLVIIAGPTAAGKTHLSVKLAKTIGGEIISADSMQVYKHMDIGTAKVKPEETDGVPHHLIDCINPAENYSIASFTRMAGEAAEEIYRNGHIPIVTGGTGFYIQALLKELDFDDGEENTAYREELAAIAQDPGKGPAHLRRMLLEADPAAAEAIHQNNVKRTIRALEYLHETGHRISERNAYEKAIEPDFNFAYFVLTIPRELLYKRIEDRVDLMVSEGLEAEVRALRDMGVPENATSMQGLGYREMYSYLEGRITLSEAIAQIKLNTRHFAKRQLTWFRREKDALWIDMSGYRDEDEIISYITVILKERGILN
ncbi:MAG: tRNA (adenosine(37)-N6)-dimethylallyltransferase MiaA [Lachnospiraceae bacterium]|nr:tRNA (adenosine(37)-N6)-dimethylallyltransferase MiaA [Lachnospiraceae bacterium]